MASKGEKTRERILAEAGRLFQKQGFRATSLSDILAATGLKKGALYFHFAGKDEIGLAVLEGARSELEAFLDETLDGKSAGAGIEKFFAGLLDWQRGIEFVGGCIFGNIALEMGDADERFASFVEKVFCDWIERIRAVVSEARVSGEIRCDLPADILARHIVASVEGGIMLSRLQKNEKPLRDTFDGLRALLGGCRTLK